MSRFLWKNIQTPSWYKTQFSNLILHCVQCHSRQHSPHHQRYQVSFNSIYNASHFIDYVYLGFDYKFLHPWLGQGLLTNSGSSWHCRRKLLTKAFHGDILKGFVNVMNNHAQNLCSKFETYSKETKPTDLTQG